MDYRIEFTKTAVKDIENLDPKIASRLLKKLKEISLLEAPLKLSKQLTGFFLPTYRFRIGDYRIIFRLNSKAENKITIIMVLKISHRKNAYD